MLDLGHGGTDRGARSQEPYCEEKKICLQTGRLVKKYLDQLGYHVVMTRTTDDFVTLPRRVEIADQAQSNIFVSVHFNSSRSPMAQGIEIFFCDKGESSRVNSSKKLAAAILSRVIRRTEAQSRGVKKGELFCHSGDQDACRFDRGGIYLES